MAELSGAFRARFTLRAPLEQALATFADPAAHAACFEGLDRHELIDPQTVRFVLPPQSYGVTTFQGDYTCRYQRQGDTVAWHTLRGNIHAQGSARFRQTDQGTLLDYEQQIRIDLDVGRLLRKTIQPIVSRSIQKEARQFVERMVRAAERGSAEIG